MSVESNLNSLTLLIQELLTGLGGPVSSTYFPAQMVWTMHAGSELFWHRSASTRRSQNDISVSMRRSPP